MAKDTARLSLEVVDVVDQAEDGLQADETNENDSQARVGLFEELINKITVSMYSRDRMSR